MDITKEVLKIDCPICKQKIILTFNTPCCPNCKATFEPEAVHEVFYKYESNLLNSKTYQTSKKIEKASVGLEKTGSFLENLGCFLFLLPLGLLGLYILANLFTN